MAVGVNLLEDVAATMEIATVGDNGSSTVTYGATVYTVNIDKATPTESLNTADHSGGQDLDEMHRTNKRIGSLDVEFKWGPQGTGGVSIPALKIGVRVRFIAVATIGGATFATCTVEGIITNSNMDFAGPSTGKISLKAYGKRLVVWS